MCVEKCSNVFSVWIKKNQLDVTLVFFISLLLVAEHVSGNHVPIIRSWRLRDVIASCWYVLWLQEGCQDRLAGGASMSGFVARAHSWTHYQHKAITSRSRQLLMMGTWLPETSRRERRNTRVTSSWFFLSTLNYDARSTTHHIFSILSIKSGVVIVARLGAGLAGVRLPI
jgi:hypothetical protein